MITTFENNNTHIHCHLGNVVEKGEDGSKGEGRDKDCDKPKLKKVRSQSYLKTIIYFYSECSADQMHVYPG